MKVPFYDHAKIYRRRKDEIDAAIFRVISSGRLDWGDEVPGFEAEFAAFVGAKHTVTVNSGTAALKVALLGLGIGPGDEVITVANTDIGSTSAIHHTGAASVWVDVDPVSLCIDPDAVRRAITKRTRALLPVDLYGHPAPLAELRAIAGEHKLFMVEDACLALGAELNGRRIGQWSDVTCFSFAPSKHLGAYGSAGACVTDDADLAERMRKISSYGQARSRHRSISGLGGQPLNHETEGLNERMDEIQAAILRVKLQDLPESLAARRAQAATYAKAFAGTAIEAPQTKPGALHAWRNYVVHVAARDRVRDGLSARGIGSALSYAPPMHLQPVYAATGIGPGSLPVSERSGARLLGLPIGPHLDDEQIMTIAAGLRGAVADAG
jgi:dTDP-3-amino-3,4,6-trideoxy-alpha-D-glucose transaminase